MRYELGIPTTCPTGDFQALIELAVLAEEAGWDAIFLEGYITQKQRDATPPRLSLSWTAEKRLAKAILSCPDNLQQLKHFLHETITQNPQQRIAVLEPLTRCTTSFAAVRDAHYW